ncbi:MAG: hypothetical protein HYR85_08655 [Planctomycetes bacterium]|nr:hypothetical protein [Planctomycetota bacterium]MBI3846904.1 hypothetical protein [Planctomycetota bacterium]
MREYRLVVVTHRATLVAGLTAIVALGAQARADVESEGLVRKAIHISESMNWSGTLAVQLRDSGTMHETRYHVQSTDGQVASIFDESSLGDGQVLTRDVPEASSAVSEGHTAVTPRAPSSVASVDDIRFDVRNEGLFFQNYSATSVRSEQILGYAVRVVRVQSRDDFSRPVFILWVDASTGFPYRIDRHDADGTLSSSSRYLDFQARGESHPAGKTPTATRLESLPSSLDEARNAVSHLVAETTLPGGFHLANVDVRKNDGDSAVALRYTDGLNDVLLLEADTRPLPTPNPDSLEGTDSASRERARRIMQQYDHEVSVRNPDGSRILARSRSFGSITSVAARSPELTTMVLGPLDDESLARMLGAVYR